MSSSIDLPEQEQSDTSSKRPLARTRDIIEDIHTATGLERGEIGRILTALYASLAERLKNGEDVDLRDFMKLTVKEYGGREYFVPATGERVERGPAGRVRVALAKKFKDSI